MSLIPRCTLYFSAFFFTVWNVVCGIQTFQFPTLLQFYARGLFASPMITGYSQAQGGALGAIVKALWVARAGLLSAIDYPLRRITGGVLRSVAMLCRRTKRGDTYCRCCYPCVQSFPRLVQPPHVSLFARVLIDLLCVCLSRKQKYTQSAMRYRAVQCGDVAGAKLPCFV